MNRFKCKQKTTKTKPITYICRDCGCKRTVRLPLDSIIPGSWESCRRCGGVTYTPEILAIWKEALKIEDVKESLLYFKEEVTKLFRKQAEDK